MLYKRRSGTGVAQGINSALGGFALGANVAMEKRRTDLQEADFLRRAQLVDAELQREEQQRQASTQAVGEMAQLSPDEMQPNAVTSGGQPAEGPPTTETSAIQDADTQAMERVSKIAQRMAAAGDRKGAIEFVNYAKERHLAMKDNRERDNLVKEAQIFLEGADTYSRAPDGSLVEDPAFADAITKLTADMGDKSIPVKALREQLRAAKSAQIQSRTRQGHRQQMVDIYRQRAADATQNLPSPLLSTGEQIRTLETLINEYEINHNQYFTENGGRAWQAEFDKRFTDAVEGKQELLDDQGKPVKVGLDNVQEFEAMKQRSIAKDEAATKLKSDLMAAQAELARANAAYADRNKPGAQGVAGGNSSKEAMLAKRTARKQASDELNEAYKAQVEQVKAANEGKKAGERAPIPPAPSSADINARAEEILRIESGGGTDEAFQPTSFQKSGAAATQSPTKGTADTPDVRIKDVTDHPEKYLDLSDDEIRMYISTGKRPR